MSRNPFVPSLSDEYYTRREDAEVIAQHLNRAKMRIWSPFDRDESEIVKVLKEHGHTVINTSTDFFSTPVPEGGVDCIISNPPFSCKKDVLDRIKKLGIPFVLILPGLWLSDGVPFDYGHQIIVFRKRMYFRTPNGELNKPRTGCFVLSDGMLQHDYTIIR